MAAAVDRVLAAVAAGGLLHPGDALIVLVSGGRDSICLLDVAATVCGVDRLLALHVDYGLRGAQSDADADHVRAACAQAGVALEVRRAPAVPDAGNRQAWARDLRYGAALSLARARDARIAAGHTSSDQAETILYRLAASPGRRALLGMAAADGLLIRPLLGVSRRETGDYCRARALTWREDVSNADGSSARGRCRHGLAAALTELHPAAEANVVRTAALLRDEAAVLDEVVDTALAGRRRIALERLAALPPALARLVVVRLAEDAHGGLVPAAGSRVAELLRLAPDGGSAELDIGGGCRAVVEYGVLRFDAVPPAPVPEEVELAVPGAAAFGAWRLEAELADGGDAPRPPAGGAAGPSSAGPSAAGPVESGREGRAPAAAGRGPFPARPVESGREGRAPAAAGSAPSPAGPLESGREGRADAAAGRDPSSAGPVVSGREGRAYAAAGPHRGLLDADALRREGLAVRGWQAGDRMTPLGLAGTKSLADLFTDRRVPRAERRTLPIVTCGGEVAWVPGVATAERFRVGEATVRTVVLRARRAGGAAGDA